MIRVGVGENKRIKAPGINTCSFEILNRVSGSVNQYGEFFIGNEKTDIGIRLGLDSSGSSKKNELHFCYFFFLRKGRATEKTARAINTIAIGFVKKTK